MNASFLVYAGGKSGAKARLFKAAQLKNHQLMRARTVEENRVFLRKLAEIRPAPPGISVRRSTVAGVPCEWVSTARSRSDRVVLYIHGGSWMYGDLRSARPTAIMLAEMCGYPVLVVDYRLSPEHPYPAALEDCCKVFQRLLLSGFPASAIGIFGDSAGGNLTLCLQQKLLMEQSPLPAAICCASPVTDLRQSSVFYQQKPDLLFAVHNGMEQDIFSLYLRGQASDNPLVSPILGELSKLPPTLIHVGEDEALCEDNISFAREAFLQGANIVCKVWPGMFHDFTIAGLALQESRISMREIAAHFTTYLL